MAEAENTPRRDEDVPKLVRRLRERRDEHRRHGRIYRGAFIAAGFTLLLGGIVMLVLPGPAFVVIPIGLAILALEFTWAERLLDRSLEKADEAKRRAAETSGTQRILAAVATAAAAGAFVAAALMYDIPVLPV